MPQIVCPNCGITINLENRKNVDYDRILYAIQKKPKTFTELLKLTGLPRKTLSLRLRDLCCSGIIVKDNGYRLNGNSMLDESKMLASFNQPFDMNWKKFVRLFTLLFIISISTGSIVSALVIKPKSIPLLAPVASFTISPDPPYYAGRMNILTFNASSSHDSDNNIVSYRWRFIKIQGQGGSSTWNAEGIITTQIFVEQGNYVVELTVMDESGLSKSSRSVVSILPTPCQKVYVDPPEITGLTIGEIFTVSINIRDVKDLFAWQFGLTFNPNVLECLTVDIPTYDEDGNTVKGTSAFEEGPFLKMGGQTILVAPSPLYVEEGAIPYHGCSLFPKDAPVTPVSGSGTLAYITFKVIGQGCSELHLTDVMLLNQDVLEIPILKIEDGYFQSP
ncbi:MAG: PKD domain-containing protein [Candidatus Bathyarchaeota archaeon]|jgi:hypothetical protein|nr:PKD domain-containing protein [Candidatus Bathyarchaeota archaeon]